MPAPILPRTVEHARIVPHIARDEVNQAGLLADVTIRDHAVACLDTGALKLGLEGLRGQQLALRVYQRAVRDVLSAGDMARALAVRYPSSGVELGKPGIHDVYAGMPKVGADIVEIGDHIILRATSPSIIKAGCGLQFRLLACARSFLHSLGLRNGDDLSGEDDAEYRGREGPMST